MAAMLRGSAGSGRCSHMSLSAGVAMKLRAAWPTATDEKREQSNMCCFIQSEPVFGKCFYFRRWECPSHGGCGGTPLLAKVEVRTESHTSSNNYLNSVIVKYFNASSDDDSFNFQVIHESSEFQWSSCADEKPPPVCCAGQQHCRCRCCSQGSSGFSSRIVIMLSNTLLRCSPKRTLR